MLSNLEWLFITLINLSNDTKNFIIKIKFSFNYNLLNWEAVE